MVFEGDVHEWQMLSGHPDTPSLILPHYLALSRLHHLDCRRSFILEHTICLPRGYLQPPAISHVLSVIVNIRLDEIAPVRLIVQITVSDKFEVCWGSIRRPACEG